MCVKRMLQEFVAFMFVPVKFRISLDFEIYLLLRWTLVAMDVFLCASCLSSVSQSDDNMIITSLPQHLPLKVQHGVFAAAQQDPHHFV